MDNSFTILYRCNSSSRTFPSIQMHQSVNRSKIMIGPGRWIVTESVQPRVNCEMVAKYSPNIDEYFMKNYV